jgi:putative membrane protein
MLRDMRSLPILAAALLAAAAFQSGAALAAASQPGQISSVRPGEGAPDRTAANMDRTDRKFAEAAAQAGLAEIAAGQLALQRSRDPRVRDYAQQLVTDHQAANAQLQRIASAKRIALPTAPSSQQQRELQSLQRSGSFDKDFLEQMARAHQKAIDLFGHEVKGRHQDAELKDFAQQTLVHLERHLGMAETLEKQSGHLPG